MASGRLQEICRIQIQDISALNSDLTTGAPGAIGAVISSSKTVVCCSLLETMLPNGLETSGQRVYSWYVCNGGVSRGGSVTVAVVVSDRRQVRQVTWHIICAMWLMTNDTCDFFFFFLIFINFLAALSSSRRLVVGPLVGLSVCPRGLWKSDL